MSELRWHPLLRQWVAVTTHRQDRPQLPETWCPFCPGSGRTPHAYDVFLYPNDFPAFSPDEEPFDPSAAGTGLLASTGARGACDVVLYHSDHNLWPSQLSVEHWGKVIVLWTRRTQELAGCPGIEYVYVFENTGIAIGVTMPHPHGQIYAFPFVPPLPQIEIDSASAHFSKTGECLYCRILAAEIREERRLVSENESFVAFVPYFARWPAELQIYSRRHFGLLGDLQDSERRELASIISIARRKYDNLYGLQIPLMMLIRQSPVKGEHRYYHFHVEFCPVQRSANKLKYLAGVESGCGTFLNDTLAEDRAQELRETEPRA